jgi:uncharacterized DUF497 family protein
MDAPTFEWDPTKAAANLQTHGVSFEEAATVFQDRLAKIHSDPDHSESENRAILIGHSTSGRLLLVAFTDRQDRIRLISARATTRRERKEYEESQQKGS